MPKNNEKSLFEELDSMDEYDFLELLSEDTPKLHELTMEEEKEIETYEQTQEEFDREFEDNLDVKSFELREREEFDPTNPKYYL